MRPIIVCFLIEEFVKIPDSLVNLLPLFGPDVWKYTLGHYFPPAQEYLKLVAADSPQPCRHVVQ